MTAEELRAIMEYLRNKVRLGAGEEGGSAVIEFETPAEQVMVDAGLNGEGVGRILRVPWWNEMVEDIVETPEMCGADDPPEQVLEYARDVVSEYIRKRFPLNAD